MSCVCTGIFKKLCKLARKRYERVAIFSEAICPICSSNQTEWNNCKRQPIEREIENGKEIAEKMQVSPTSICFHNLFSIRFVAVFIVRDVPFRSTTHTAIHNNKNSSDKKIWFIIICHYSNFITLHLFYCAYFMEHAVWFHTGVQRANNSAKWDRSTHSDVDSRSGSVSVFFDSLAFPSVFSFVVVVIIIILICIPSLYYLVSLSCVCVRVSSVFILFSTLSSPFIV